MHYNEYNKLFIIINDYFRLLYKEEILELFVQSSNLHSIFFLSTNKHVQIAFSVYL